MLKIISHFNLLNLNYDFLSFLYYLTLSYSQLLSIFSYAFYYVRSFLIFFFSFSQSYPSSFCHDQDGLSCRSATKLWLWDFVSLFSQGKFTLSWITSSSTALICSLILLKYTIKSLSAKHKWEVKLIIPCTLVSVLGWI